MANSDLATHTTTAKDVKQLGIWAALGSLSYVFWICGGMEMVERLAYYGVRQVSSLYATDAKSNGGLGLTGAAVGIIFTVWAFVQSFVPVLTGGISDRVGYKETIFASTIFKILGYLLMAWFPTFWGFMAGAVVLAFGTGIFKPGIQATIVKSTSRQNSSIAWGVFYQTVNIGGFIGPLVAAQLRQLEWAYVFYACAAIISINFLLLLTYKEVDKEERLAHRAKVKSGEIKETSLWRDSLRELLRPILIWYMVLFSGFWFMLYAFWDVAPLYFRDWVDTSVMVRHMFGEDGTSNRFWIFFFGMTQDGQRIQPEGLVNLNAMLIMIVCFIVAGWSALMRATNSMAIGTFLAAGTLMVFGGFNYVWIVVLAIVSFSIGEMLSSPKSSEYLGNIAPDQKKAMYLGFSQLPLGIGWSLEGFFGQYLYGRFGAKDTIARDQLLDSGMSQAGVDAVPIGEAFQKLVEVTGQSAEYLTAQLYAANNVGIAWYIMGSVGIVAAAGMYVYGRWTYQLKE
ncbi:MAG: MFS transporter [Gammaproteobacteria bacterium]|nr:MFS transporter [Gammaproteobacteria bacterium]MDH3374616.1 MFS transporter [Gammaproteobacteria bacterium]MDH3410011.1 MFS transporter [Gammaproteobacteria bacterium]MDH3552381.1 MFS transporter [Gammaproteobacteria bacterium]